ncbi:MAG TPA: class I SAM-dependent methyltransferase [Thermoleophilaceae bacterium]|nr:class I SAM-dependent methyltransferase [Thermoleophilaceae bacterium]
MNVGAGAGSYEPADRDVVAVEPSETMIAQRPAGSAPVVRAYAEDLPFEDGAFDAAMVVLSDHHWRDHARGLAELRRVARRVVIFGWDPATVLDMWIVRDYFPDVQELIPAGYRLAHTLAGLGDARAEPVPIPHDCVDGFFHAYWRRPEAYLDEEVRAGISVFARLDRAAVERGVESLGRDLESGEWERRNGHLRALDEIEAGYRLVSSG